MRTILGSLALVSAMAAAACSGEAAPSTPPSAGGRGGLNAAVPVTVATVEQKSVPLEIQGIGTVIAATTVQVRAQITGEMTSVNFKEGEDVKEGQVLVTLDKRPLEAALRQAEATLARDVAQVGNARAQAARYTDLQNRGIATKEQVDTITSQAAALEATVNADRASIENAKVQLDYATISSPISGRTGLLQVHPGNLVRANDTTPIVTVNKITPVYVSFAIPEAQLALVKSFMASGKLSVTAQPPDSQGRPAVGRINFMDNAVDTTTGTIKIKGTFANEDRRLWPGQFVNVNLTLSADPHAIVVPAPAVQTGQQGTYVFVVKADQTVELRPITVSRTRGTDFVIQKGLTAGEIVVTDGHLRLVTGTRVSIKGGGRDSTSS